MLSKKLRQYLFRISPREALFAVRGFEAVDAVRTHLEPVGITFLQGYQSAIDGDSMEEIVQPLTEIDTALRGFGFEGAAMGLAVRDFFTLGRNQWVHKFLQGPGSPHIYMAHVGIGWWYARLRRPLSGPPAHLDPLLGWLALDGYGFHEGYFHWPQSIAQHTPPRRLHGYARRAFDQGLGRSLWFVKGADVDRIAQTINTFAAHRRPDLWAGIGLACTYAGGVPATAVQKLRALAGQTYQDELAQGAAFAAKARQRAHNIIPHTEVACEILCQMSAQRAAEITDLALEQLPADSVIPAYEIWRQRIKQQLISVTQSSYTVVHNRSERVIEHG